MTGEGYGPRTPTRLSVVSRSRFQTSETRKRKAYIMEEGILDDNDSTSTITEPSGALKRHKKPSMKYLTSQIPHHRYSTSNLPPPNSHGTEGMELTTKYGGPNNVLGQFSYAPATQTTVVTTTTTTTTKFPPFVMPAPKHLEDLDPKVYPLASTSTPESLKTISFESDGKTTIFHEFEDSKLSLEQVCGTHFCRQFLLAVFGVSLLIL